MGSRIARKLAISVATLVVVVGGAELICRAAGLGPNAGYFRWEADPDVGFKPMPNQQTLFGKADPATGAGLMPIRINAFGQRGEDFPLAKPPGERRVVVVGDSLTMGQGVLDGETYPHRLGELLRERDGKGRTTRVINAGVNSWTTWNYAQWVEHRLPEFDADLLVVGLFLGNDMLLPAEGAGTIPVPLETLLRDSALYHTLMGFYREYLWKRVEASRRNMTAEELEGELDRYQGKVPSDLSESDQRVLWRKNALPQLMRIRDVARAEDIGLVVLLIPTCGMVNGDESTGVHDFLRSEFEAEEVSVATCIDELRAAGLEAWLAFDVGHLSVLGNRVVAQALARQLGSP
jgi:lysophospholipase L1-like esterase